MYLVLEKKDKPGKWEVAWTWLPFFLAADKELHKEVDKEMTEFFKGTRLQGDIMGMFPPSMTPILMDMTAKVIEIICKKYPIPGLNQYLESIVHVEPDLENEDGVAQEC